MDLDDLYAYIEQRFKDIEKQLSREIGHITDKLQDTLGPIRVDVERLRSSIGELYDMDRNQAGEISKLEGRLGQRAGEAETRIAQLEQGQKDKDRGASRIIAILGVIVAAMGIAAAFVI